MQLSLQLVLQDYRVHIKHTDSTFEYVPYFSLPANDLTEVIAPSCYSCFDYPNALADLVRKHRQPGWRSAPAADMPIMSTVHTLTCMLATLAAATLAAEGQPCLTKDELAQHASDML